MGLFLSPLGMRRFLNVPTLCQRLKPITSLRIFLIIVCLAIGYLVRIDVPDVALHLRVAHLAKQVHVFLDLM